MIDKNTFTALATISRILGTLKPPPRISISSISVSFSLESATASFITLFILS